MMPTTPAGARAVELAEQHAAEFATRAAGHDAEGSFVAENVEAMRASGFLSAAAPVDCGGLGVWSVHDLVVAVSRLARGCPSSAIVATMHMGWLMDLSRTMRESGEEPRRARQIRMLLRTVVRSGLLVCNAGTEPGGSALAFPSTEAVLRGDEYVINGRKTFATNSASAGLFTAFVRVPDGEGWYRLGSAVLRRDQPGLTVSETWNSMGMRGSGSNDVILQDCRVPAAMVQVGDPVGVPSPRIWPGLLMVNFPLVAAHLGIAEAALQFVVELAGTRRKKPFGVLMADRPTTQLEIAEMRVGLAAARAAMERTCVAVDELLARPTKTLSMDDVHEVTADWQCTKLVVNRAAADIVDRAMNLAGGGSYLSGHPLGRMYRDVRAGPFMQPYAPGEALEFIGRVALGLDPFAELRTLGPASVAPVPTAPPTGPPTGPPVASAAPVRRSHPAPEVSGQA